MTLVLTLVTGVLYPLAVTGIAQLAFRRQAGGSLIVRDGHLVGSSLIGQPFYSAHYFWSRPSATSPAYNGGASTGSNLGPRNPAYLDSIRARVAALRRTGIAGPVPGDLVTSSGSGLDPDISPAAAEAQVSRVAAARGLSADAVRALVSRHTSGRTFGLLGEPRVHVLELNLDLDGAAHSVATRR
jgi:K+-transporting ATPase ATPase C chain